MNPDCGDAQLRLAGADLEFVKINPEFEMGIRGFSVKRQMRAIEGQRNLTAACAPHSGRSEYQGHGNGRPIMRETGSGSETSTCHDSCRGKAWGPHAIHICDFDI